MDDAASDPFFLYLKNRTVFDGKTQLAHSEKSDKNSWYSLFTLLLTISPLFIVAYIGIPDAVGFWKLYIAPNTISTAKIVAQSHGSYQDENFETQEYQNISYRFVTRSGKVIQHNNEEVADDRFLKTRPNDEVAVRYNIADPSVSTISQIDPHGITLAYIIIRIGFTALVCIPLLLIGVIFVVKGLIWILSLLRGQKPTFLSGTLTGLVEIKDAGRLLAIRYNYHFCPDRSMYLEGNQTADIEHLAGRQPPRPGSKVIVRYWAPSRHEIL